MQTATDYTEAGGRLRELAARKGWSQRRLADVAGLSESTLRIYIRGRRNDDWPFNPNGPTVRQIADAFGLPTGIAILEMFGFDAMVDDFKRDHLHQEQVVDLTALTDRIDQQDQRLEAQAEQIGTIIDTLRSLVGSIEGSVSRLPGPDRAKGLLLNPVTGTIESPRPRLAVV